MNRLLIEQLAVGVVALACVQAAEAATYNLGDLINSGGSLTLDDKIFGNFGFSAVGFNAADATVTPTIVNGSDVLSFQGPWSVSAGAVADIGLQYTVTTTGANKINMIDQSFVLSAAGSGGLISIGETLWSQGFGLGGPVAQSSVSFVANVGDFVDPPGEAVQGDNLIVNPALSEVWVQKDIFLAANGDGQVGTTIISQSFHQTTAIPDGGLTVALLGFSFMGVAGLRRRFCRTTQ